MSKEKSHTTTASEDLSHFRSVEIGPAFPHFQQKEMTRESPIESPAVSRRNIDLIHLNNGHEQVFQNKILQLKKQQQLQQEILLQHFQDQQRQLAEQHEQQLWQHYKESWEQQRELEERERELREKVRLESLKKKEEHEQSAVASSEVKQKLQGFLLNRKQREAAAAASNGVTGPSSQGYHSWSVLPSPSSDSTTSVGVAGSTPYPLNPLLRKYDEDFPLRKTASEPNLKNKLKQRMYERRLDPIARRKDRLLRKKSQLAMNSNPESGPNSPPVLVNNCQISPSAGHSTPIQEESEPTYGKLTISEQNGSLSNLSSLYSSPSMPNISLGRPPISNESSKLAPVSEAEVRAAFTARLGIPLTGQILSGTLPFYPTLSAIDSDYCNSTSPSEIHKQMQSLEQSRSSYSTLYHGPQPITDSQVALARLTKQGHRPLGRTQSAPLPLGHPMLATTTNLGVHYEDYSQQQLHQQQTHNLLKQQIRQTVLTRAGSRVQSSNNCQLSESLENDNAEVIDLTDKKCDRVSNEESEICRQQRERETFLQQQRDLMMRHTLQVSEGSAFSIRSSRPLSRALSSPLVALGNEVSSNPTGTLFTPTKLSRSSHRQTTGIGWDSIMLKHGCVCSDNTGHPEHGGRLQSVWARLVETGLIQRCDRIRSRKASLEELQACHSEPHTLLFGTNSLSRQKLDMNKLSQLPMKSFVRLPCGGVGVDSDTTWNELHTAPAARMAVGCVVDLAFKTMAGDIKNGFAVVRPPGHHAEESQAMGFCFFNSIAIAARLLQQKLDLRRILIVDWDVHHGNGTQQMFYEDKRILYLSIHRHDDGNFFPGTGGPTECGAGNGLGYNVNVAWSGGLNPPMGDAEYLAAFRSIVMPIARDYVPDIILVSAGFDAAVGHPPPLGGYKLSPACFGYMTQQLMQLADGKVVLALEGGYDLPAICDSAEECVKALLGDEPSPIKEEELHRLPCQNAIDTLQKTIAIQLSHWPILKLAAHTVMCSAVEATLSEENETVTAMASLSMNKQNSNHIRSTETSREASVEPMEEDEEVEVNK